jgi:small conductance mechanosensitive channel
MENYLFAGPVNWTPLLLAAAPTLLGAWLMSRLARRLAGSVLQAAVGNTLPKTSPLIRGPVRLVGAVVLLLSWAILLFPAFEMAGLRPRMGRTVREIASWLFGSGLRIALILLVGYALRRATDLLVHRFEHEVERNSTSATQIDRTRRAQTLGSVVNTVATALIVAVASVMILNELGVNIGPVLTGAGIAGLALGFAAQTLLRDLISGFLLILEDQLRVGDAAAINGTEGAVEHISLRTVTLRDARGTLHVFPNGTITSLANQSKDFSFYVIDFNIPYDDDPDRVFEIAREVGEELRSEPQFAPVMNEVQTVGVVAYGDWSMQLRVRIKTPPQQQWDVGREFRKRLRKALNRHGIAVPYPMYRPAGLSERRESSAR